MTHLATNFFSSLKLATAIQKIDYPKHQGKPNPSHGKFFVVGTIPWACYDDVRSRSKIYETEDAAIRAVIAGGATFVQGADCRIINHAEYV